MNKIKLFSKTFRTRLILYIKIIDADGYVKSDLILDKAARDIICNILFH